MKFYCFADKVRRDFTWYLNVRHVDFFFKNVYRHYSLLIQHFALGISSHGYLKDIFLVIMLIPTPDFVILILDKYMKCLMHTTRN